MVPQLRSHVNEAADAGAAANMVVPRAAATAAAYFARVRIRALPLFHLDGSCLARQCCEQSGQHHHSGVPITFQGAPGAAGTPRGDEMDSQPPGIPHRNRTAPTQGRPGQLPRTRRPERSRPVLRPDAHRAPGRTAPAMARRRPPRRPAQPPHSRGRHRPRPRRGHRRTRPALELRRRRRTRQQDQDAQAGNLFIPATGRGRPLAATAWRRPVQQGPSPWRPCRPEAAGGAAAPRPTLGIGGQRRAVDVVLDFASGLPAP